MVHIVCVDVNDNCPVWESSNMFVGSVLENMPTGTSIALVIKCKYTILPVCHVLITGSINICI